MKQAPNLSLQLVHVRQSDVEKMLNYYDSGMADVSTSNAIALALKRILKPGHQVRVIRDSGRGDGAAHVGEHKIVLPSELLGWLETAERASSVDPVSFQVALPNDWLKRPVKAPRERNRAEQMPMVA